MSTTLDTISAADFLALAQNGEIDINDFIETEKVASNEEVSLSELSDEDLLALAEELELEEDDLEKEAGDFDLNNLSVEEFIEVAAHLEQEMVKEASENIDINALSVNEFMELASILESESMVKEAKQGFFSKYVPGVAQFQRGQGVISRLDRTRKGAVSKLKDGQKLTDEGTASASFKKRSKNPKASKEDQLKDMEKRLPKAKQDRMFGGLKMGGTAVGTGLGLYGAKKATFG